jgi:LCP family protein required for cell wall assembly
MAQPGPRNKVRRTWPQRVAVLLGSGTAVACLATGGGLWWANRTVGRIQRVDIRGNGVPTLASTSTAATKPGEPAPSTTEPTVEPLVDKKALNFLIVGSDARDCIDPESPYAGAFISGGADTGFNSDTIMAVRVDPVTSQAAILSFPRDLWITFPGSTAKGKINSMYEKKDPSKLVATIQQNFGFRVDHYIDVDFCAVKDVVDALDGVSVPFEFPAFDKNTGLNILDPGCHKFEGEEALAYLRSRYYQWYDGKRWRDDPNSDLSRIARQQDFVKRLLAKSIDKGARRPTVAKKLLDVALDRVKVDRDLTGKNLLSLAQALKGLDPTSIKTYRIDGPFGGGGSYIIPDFQNPTNVGILKVFKGEARLADAALTGGLIPDAATSSTVAATTTTAATTTVAVGTTTVAVGTTGAGASSSTSSSSSTSAAATTTSTPPEITIAEPTKLNNAIVPPNDPTCR